jgi:sugar phosphate isomerase/epimerase
MHASDRSLAPGASIEDLQKADGATGYAAVLKHGEVGRGMIDYDAVFRMLSEVGFDGWISIEDGMNGLDEMRRSVEFLRRKRAEYFHGGSPKGLTTGL